MTRVLLFLAGLAVAVIAPSMPVAIGSALLWFAWTLVPGLLWSRSTRAIADPPRWLLAGLLHLLALAALWDLTGRGASSLGWALSLSGVLPLVARWRAPEYAPSAARLPGRALALACALLAVWMALRPAPVALYSDGPAHLATIREAMAQDSLRPSDPSPGAPGGLHDPRFGLLHGVHAAISIHGSWDPEDVVRAAPIVFSPLWLIAHASLFSIFLGGRWLPLLCAALFTIAGADARLYGLWSVAYPGSFALACAALALAATWRDRAWSARPGTGELLLALTLLVHPFAWWGSCVVLCHAASWRALQKRSLRRASVASAFKTLLLGALVATPLLLARAASAEGPHAEPVNVVDLGSSGLYLCDPFRVMRWSGALAPWLLPLLLLGSGRILGEARGALLIAGPLALWTVAFNPLVQPWIYPIVGYLSERLGRMGYVEVAACFLVARAWRERYLPRRPGARSWRFAGAIVGLILLARSGEWGVRVLRADPARFSGPDIHVLDAVLPALDAMPQARLLADPRGSYALAARRAGKYVLTPIAHASPNDRGVETRLALYRSLLDPYAEPETIVDALRDSNADLLLVHTRLSQYAEPEEFGFVADDERQRRLLRRLTTAGNAALASGDDWALFEVATLRPGSALPADDCLLLGEPDAIARGKRFEVVALQPVQREIAAGDTLAVDLVYRVRQDAQAADHAKLDRVHLRLEGDMPRLPGWLQPVGKPLRKLLIERSGPSERRFGMALVPFGAYRDPETWSTEFACERVTLRVPPRMPPGSYGIQVTIHAEGWLPRHRLRDYLSDRDRFSAQPVAYVEIVDKSGASVSAGGDTR